MKRIVHFSLMSSTEQNFVYRSSHHIVFDKTKITTYNNIFIKHASNFQRHVSKAVFSKSYQLLTFECRARLYDVPNHFIKIVRGKSGFVSVHRVKNLQWTERYPRLHECAVPYLPYGFSEMALLLSRLNWRSSELQTFPMLPINVSREFGPEHFTWAFRVTNGSSNIGSGFCYLLFEPPYGKTSGGCDRFEFDLKNLFILKDEGHGETIVASKRRVPLRISASMFPSVETPHSTSRQKIVAKTSSPIALNLWKSFNGNLVHLWLFDIFRTSVENTFGTHSQREQTRQLAEHIQANALYFGEVLGPCPIWGQKLKVSFQELQNSVLDLWNQLPQNTRDNLIILSFDENNFIAPAIFRHVSPQPRLILVNTFWGSRSKWLSLCPTSYTYMAEMTETPTNSLIQTCGDYKRPILALGAYPPPKKWAHIKFHQSRWKGRFLNVLGVRSPFGSFEYTPRPWHPSFLALVKRWI